MKNFYSITFNNAPSTMAPATMAVPLAVPYRTLEAGRLDMRSFALLLHHKAFVFSALAYANGRVLYSTGKGKLSPSAFAGLCPVKDRQGSVEIGFEKVYLNADMQKSNILSENNRKSGIYL
jgi:hypothetical protein